MGQIIDTGKISKCETIGVDVTRLYKGQTSIFAFVAAAHAGKLREATPEEQSKLKTFEPGELRGMKIRITKGNGAGEIRDILDNGACSIITSKWVVKPDETSEYEIIKQEKDTEE